MEYISMAEVKYKANGYFFSDGATRFFNSRYPQNAYRIGDKAYFVTSEKFDYKSPRLFTVRFLDLKTGNVDTLGEFQAYTTKAQALGVIKRLDKAV